MLYKFHKHALVYPPIYAVRNTVGNGRVYWVVRGDNNNFIVSELHNHYFDTLDELQSAVVDKQKEYEEAKKLTVILREYYHVDGTPLEHQSKLITLFKKIFHNKG